MSLRRKDRDYIGPLQGWPAFFHRLTMFILFPLRKPLIFFPVLLLLFLVPTFFGVKPAEVHLWYWKKAVHYTSVAVSYIQKNTKDILPKELKTVVQSLTPKEPALKGRDKLVDYQTVDVNANRRAIFERASGAAMQPVDIEIELDEDIDETGAQFEPEIAKISKPEEVVVRDFEDNHKPDDRVKPAKRKLPLVYLEEPKEVIGEMVVHNANEVEVDGTYIFLYGIYVDPDSEQGIRGAKFLEYMVKEQKVRCSIVAYTKQGVATGMCYLRGENLNKLLVTNKYSKNVAL